MKKKTLLAIFICAFIIVGSLIIGGEGEFEGADGEIEQVIGEVDPTYEPWFENVWTPPSGEIESLLFALQAALGAGFIGYYIGKNKMFRLVSILAKTVRLLISTQ